MAEERCPECHTGLLAWHLAKDNTGGAMDGRLRMHDVSIIAFLACEECGETLRHIDQDVVEAMLTEWHNMEWETESYPIPDSSRRRRVGPWKPTPDFGKST